MSRKWGQVPQHTALDCFHNPADSHAPSSGGIWVSLWRVPYTPTQREPLPLFLFCLRYLPETPWMWDSGLDTALADAICGSLYMQGRLRKAAVGTRWLGGVWLASCPRSPTVGPGFVLRCAVALTPDPQGPVLGSSVSHLVEDPSELLCSPCCVSVSFSRCS